MEIKKNEPLLELKDGGAKTNNQDPFSALKENNTAEKQETDSQGSTSSQNEFQNSNEQDDAEFQESGYLSSSQTMEDSPTDNCTDPVAQTNSPPPQKDTPPLSTTNFPPLPKFPTTLRSGGNEKRKAVKQKPISSQMSLDKFAFKKGRATTENGETEATVISPKRIALADRSPPNHKLEGKFNESQQEDMGGENWKENFRNIVEDRKNEEEDVTVII